jgi:cell division septum initiation protein DivIVA
VDVHARLAELRQAVEGARSMPMSASAVINRSEVLELVDGLEKAVDAALVEARAVLADRDAVVDEGRRQADEILAEARSEREAIMSDTEVYRVAKREADALIEQARSEAEALRRETDEYVDAKLANFEITLERTTEAVKRGRERLAGRTELDALTEDEADKIRLPEHLER